MAALETSGLILPAAASLVDQLDKKVLVRLPPPRAPSPRARARRATARPSQIILRDGRNLVGVMRSFDQFSNVVLEDTYERRVVIPDDEALPAVYGDVPLGLYVIRGDSVVLLGEISDEREQSDAHPRPTPIEDVVALEQSGEGQTAVVWDIQEDC